MVIILFFGGIAAICYYLSWYFKNAAKKAKKAKRQTVKEKPVSSQPASAVTTTKPIQPVEQKQEASVPKDGMYPSDHLAKLEAGQTTRREQNAHYKIAVIDFETTGVHPRIDEILQVSIIDEEENVLINQYCKATFWPSWDDASRINGIWPKDVAFCPVFKEVAPYVQDILSRADIVIAYNCPFEQEFLRENKIDPDAFKWGNDPMKLAAKYYNKQFNSRRSKIRLIDAAKLIEYEYNPHDALEDVKATLHV